MQKNSDLEILVTELKNENKNNSIDKKDMFDELTEYKKKEIIIKNSYQDNFTNLLDNLEKINSKFDKNNFKELSNIMKFKTVSSIPDFIKMSTNEIIELTEENKKMKNELKELNIKLFDLEQEHLNLENDKKDIEEKFNKLNSSNENTTKENTKLKKQMNDNNEIINQLNTKIANNKNELNTKNNMIENLNCEINKCKDQNLKLNNDKEYLLTIVMRLCQLFPNANVYKLVNLVMTYGNISIEEKENINNQLLCELKKCENYITLLKDNELSANYLNRQLTRQYQDMNKNKLSENTNFILNKTNYNNNNSLNSSINRNNNFFMENSLKKNPYVSTNYTSSLNYK
jgi:hypothetical protein